MKGCG